MPSCYNNNMIKITHEFPLSYYLNGKAEALTDYDYCLVHRYLDHPEYANYMKEAVKKGRIVYLDNSLFELGAAFDQDKYAEAIRELEPTYYVTPDVFNKYEENIESQLNFIKKYSNSFKNSKPLVVCHGTNTNVLLQGFIRLNKELPSEAMIAIPFGSAAFQNKEEWPGYFNKKDISYEPYRMALNRKLFLNYIAKEANETGRRVHMLGCKSAAEFDNWESDFDKSFIFSIDTSQPVAMSLEGTCSYYDCGFFVNDDGTKLPSRFYKPLYLIDKHFDVDYNNKEVLRNTSDLERNIKYFRDCVQKWGN